MRDQGGKGETVRAIQDRKGLRRDKGKRDRAGGIKERGVKRVREIER